MEISATRPNRRSTLNLRIKPEMRSMIDRAAALLGKSRTDFVLEAAHQAAEDALLSQTLIRVNPDAFASFTAALDAPPRANARLRKTMTTPAPWE
jgi:uncharacterized protein (DUF1778 family)